MRSRRMSEEGRERPPEAGIKSPAITQLDPRTTTGGRALGFFATQRIDFNKVKIEKGDGFTENEALKISYRIRKNRCVFRNPYVKGSIIAIYGEGIDRYGEIAYYAPRLGIVEKGGSWIYYPSKAAPATIGGTEMKFNSAAAFIQELEKNEEACEFFFKEVMARINDAASLSESMDDDEIEGIKKQDKADREALEADADPEDLQEEPEAAEEATEE